MVDNLSDALIMAGSVLVFVIALTVCISSFTNMRTQIDSIIEHDYKLDLVTDESGNYLNYYTSDSDVRTVGVETVVSSMYRVSKENYVVYIAGLPDSDIPDEIKTVNDISQKHDGNQIIKPGDDVIKISIGGSNYDVDKMLNDYGLYEEIKGRTFKEYLGVYQEATDESVADVNKTTYRVITYVVQ